MRVSDSSIVATWPGFKTPIFVPQRNREDVRSRFDIGYSQQPSKSFIGDVALSHIDLGAVNAEIDRNYIKVTVNTPVRH